ncbi:MAG: nucleotide exchange factor GrpE [Candidatus Paceibacterota bacterium]
MSKKKQPEMDDDFEAVEEDVVSLSKKGDADKLKKRLTQCLKERQEYLDGWQRAQADFINYKKKEDERRAQGALYAKEDVLSQLLPVLDSFDMAFANKEAWEQVDATWRTGVEHIHAHLLKVLEENGMAQDDPQGEKFDPRKHESVEVRETDKAQQEGIILEVIQKGYFLNETLLRPARVIVSLYKK